MEIFKLFKILFNLNETLYEINRRLMNLEEYRKIHDNEIEKLKKQINIK